MGELKVSLQAEVARTSVASVARRLGISRGALSSFLIGKATKGTLAQIELAEKAKSEGKAA